MTLQMHALSFIGQILVWAVLITVLPGRFVSPLFRWKFVAIILFFCLLVPVNGLALGQWLRSATGDLSLISLVIFSNILAQRLFGHHLLTLQSRKTLLFGIVSVGVLFYPFALGLSTVDPYYFGYAPTGITLILVLFSVIAWFQERRDLAVVLLLPILAFNLKMLESTNLWDYLLDPVLFVYAVVQGAGNIKFTRFKDMKFKYK